jgi:hypothetical protein
VSKKVNETPGSTAISKSLSRAVAIAFRHRTGGKVILFVVIEIAWRSAGNGRSDPVPSHLLSNGREVKALDSRWAVVYVSYCQGRDLNLLTEPSSTKNAEAVFSG